MSFQKRPKNVKATQNALAKGLRSVSVSLLRLLKWPRRAEKRVVETSCGICFEATKPFQVFLGMVCSHRFCCSCIGLHIRSKLQQNLLHVHCPEPNCSENLNPEKCKGILPNHTIEKWKSALVEAKIPFSQRFYCPFKDCSALLLKGVPELQVGSSTTAMEKSECPACKRFFCVQCSEPWHEGLDCSEFKKLSSADEKNELMLFKLAEKNQWKQCPRCGHMVAKTSGCRYIICRCGCSLCYDCGSKWQKCLCNCSVGRR